MIVASLIKEHTVNFALSGNSYGPCNFSLRKTYSTESFSGLIEFDSKWQRIFVTSLTFLLDQATPANNDISVVTKRKLHGLSMFAVKAKIYGVLYNQASSIAFDETSSYCSALKSS